MKAQTVYFKDGKSDKLYTASVNDAGVVQFAWGRRGGTMQTKTEGPMSPGDAELLMSRKLAEKRSKGYVDGEAATPLVTAGFEPVNTLDTPATDPVTPEGTPVSSIAGRIPAAHLALVPKPMLLNEIDDAELLRLASDPDWWMQEKRDGNRILLVKSAGALTSYSRSGRETNALPKPIVEAAMKCACDFVLDGEIIGDVVWAFDLLRATVDLTASPYHGRYDILLKIFGDSMSGIIVVDTATTPEGKLAMFESVRAKGGEGVVLKLSSAKYSPGRPNSGGPSLKYKLVATASVIVASVNQQRSVNMKLVDGTDVGRVTIPPNHEVPAAGSIIEVRYLYAHRGGSLSQAVYLGVREDIDASECVIGQLKFKNEAAQ